MCKFCEKMEDLIDITYKDNTNLNVVLCHVACGKFKPGFIQVEFDPYRNGIKGNGIYSGAFAVNYCPVCGRKLED